MYDGSEIQESVFVLKHIAVRGGEYSCFAPDQSQMHVVNHTKVTQRALLRKRRILKSLKEAPQSV